MESNSTLLLEDAWRTRVNFILSPEFTLAKPKLVKILKAMCHVPGAPAPNSLTA